MANMSSFSPQPGEQYPIQLGMSFGPDAKSILSIAYSFKPVTLDQSRPAAAMLTEGRAQLEYHNVKPEGAPVCLAGNYSEKNMEYVLAFDPQAKTFILERLSAAVTQVNITGTRRASLLQRLPNDVELAMAAGGGTATASASDGYTDVRLNRSSMLARSTQQLEKMMNDLGDASAAVGDEESSDVEPVLVIKNS
jgi:hypothetical protein